MAGSLVNGAVSLGASDAIAPAVAAGGAAAMGGAVATGGVSALAAATQGAMQATTSGVSLAQESGASGIGAALKGFGHAVSATATETGRAAQAGLGLKPPSPNATDSRGRIVENLGARAASNLLGQAQKVRETKAGTPIAGKEGMSDPLNVGGAAKSGVAPATETSPRQSGAAVAPSDHAPELRQPDPGNPNWGSRIAPPQLPPDTPPSSAVSIRLDTED